MVTDISSSIACNFSPIFGIELQTKRHKMGSSDTAKYSPFEIPFNPDPLRTPRKLRMVCIGAGFAGLTLAYKIQYEKKLDGIIDLQIYERLVRSVKHLSRSSLLRG